MEKQPINLLQFQKRFHNELQCLNYLSKLRWPKGFTCPRCGATRHSLVSTRRLYQCAVCRYQASVTAGTIFHKTRTPIQKWFWMIFMMTRQKSGVSILRMQKLLGIASYKTAWLMGHKIRKGMEDQDLNYRLAGLLEMDGAFFGPRKRAKQSRQASDGDRLVIGIETSQERPGFFSIRLLGEVKDLASPHQDPNISSRSSIRVSRLDVVPKSSTDNGYDMAHNKISKPEAIDGFGAIRAALFNARGNIKGVHHGVSARRLQKYLAEFCYRFNRRSVDSRLFSITVTACLSSPTITWDELMV